MIEFVVFSCDGFFLQIEQKDIGDLLKIRIGHDGKGFGAGWHLDKVKEIHIYEMSWVFSEFQ